MEQHLGILTIKKKQKRKYSCDPKLEQVHKNKTKGSQILPVNGRILAEFRSGYAAVWTESIRHC